MSFFTIILAVAALSFLFFLWQSSRKQKSPKKESDSPKALSIENVAPGGVFSVAGVGPDLRDIDFVVDAHHQYRQGGFKWHELECSAGNEKFWVEIEKDDELEISITLRKLKLSDLGVSKSELEKIDDNEEGEIVFEGVRYEYEDSGKAQFLRNGQLEDAEEFYFWDFESDDEQHFVSVEKWSDGSFEASYSEPIKPSQISVFSLRASPESVS